MIYKILFLSFFLLINLSAEEIDVSLIRQKLEIQELKNELTNFYNEKEKEYQDKQKELDDKLSQIEKEKENIQAIKDKNEELLKVIREETTKKAISIYEKMKPKSAAAIFDQMIYEGKIDDVFDIIVSLKDSLSAQILKSMSQESASKVTQKLKNYSKN